MEHSNEAQQEKLRDYAHKGKGEPNAKNIAFVPDESPAPLGLLTNHVRGKGGIAKKKI